MRAYLSNRIPAIAIVLIMITAAICMAWTYTYDTDDPANTDSPTLGAQEIRELKAMLQARNNVDHYWPIDGNNQVDHADTGKHRQVTFQALISDPTPDTGEGIIWGKDGGSSEVELAYDDDSDNTVQITKAGNLYIQAAAIEAEKASILDQDTIDATAGVIGLKAGGAATGIKKGHLATDAGEFLDDVTRKSITEVGKL